MIKEVSIKSFGPLASLEVKDLGNINLLIGYNGTGKTFFLKALYASQKSVEQHQRGKEPRNIKGLLFDNLYWTFQSDPIGNIVKKGDSMLSFYMKSARKEYLSYTFGSSTASEIKLADTSFAPTETDSIFIPAKEVISLQDIILKSYDTHKVFGFDKTYVDLARAMGQTVRGKSDRDFSKARDILKEALGGKLLFDEGKKIWIFRDNEKKTHEITLTSEGVKRLSILELLLGNHYLTKNSIVFIDEAEANLHPSLIAKFMEIIVLLAKSGVQFFISTHSYFVIKNLYVLAHTHDISIPTLSFDQGGATRYDLKDGMPQNPIVRESINLYRREIEL